MRQLHNSETINKTLLLNKMKSLLKDDPYGDFAVDNQEIDENIDMNHLYHRKYLWISRQNGTHFIPLDNNILPGEEFINSCINNFRDVNFYLIKFIDEERFVMCEFLAADEVKDFINNQATHYSDFVNNHERTYFNISRNTTEEKFRAYTGITDDIPIHSFSDSNFINSNYVDKKGAKCR